MMLAITICELIFCAYFSMGNNFFANLVWEVSLQLGHTSAPVGARLFRDELNVEEGALLRTENVA